MNNLQRLNTLHKLKFDNRFVDELPADPEMVNKTRQVYGACYSPVKPVSVSKPRLAAYSGDVAGLLEIDDKDCLSDEFTQVFSGNRLLPSMQPFATCYGGHQFGVWAGQLGDGRAINLGDVVNSRGERWALQLKGAGLTPYSRMADGLAVLRSSIREFLCSEAMFHLGVPTTRALSVITTGETVVRDMFYDGRPKAEPGAVVCRVAPTFLRFGHYQIFAARGDLETLKKLLDHTIRTHFAQLGDPSRETYLAWFEEVCRTTVEMVVQWQRVGFVHGVMNTDNMSILGLTIDYGPYGWLENYHPDWTPNTTDRAERRYRFGNQPACAFWNLAQLANAIYPLIGRAKPLQQLLENCITAYEQHWRSMMLQKLGLNRHETETDAILLDRLVSMLQAVETDMTIFFRTLADVEVGQGLPVIADNEALLKPLAAAYYDQSRIGKDYAVELIDWLKLYDSRLTREGVAPEARRERMNSVNPKYVLRNYLAQLAIDKAEQEDFTLLNELLILLRRPYDEQADNEIYAAKRPEWARQRPGCSMLSCSS